MLFCSGAKSILDLDKTFEILETLRISRLGFKTNYMPGFWYYNTDKKVDHNFSNINELIDYLKIRDHIDQTGSILIFNPVPKNKSINEKLIQKWIKLSIDKAKINSIKGKELTPFLIKEINILTKRIQSFLCIKFLIIRHSRPFFLKPFLNFSGFINL